jgi:hypothetical protein
VWGSLLHEKYGRATPPSGTVYVRVVDTARSGFEQILNRIDVDHIYIRSFPF